MLDKNTLIDTLIDKTGAKNFQNAMTAIREQGGDIIWWWCIRRIFLRVLLLPCLSRSWKLIADCTRWDFSSITIPNTLPEFWRITAPAKWSTWRFVICHFHAELSGIWIISFELIFLMQTAQNHYPDFRSWNRWYVWCWNKYWRVK